MTPSTDELRKLPLFANITDEHIKELLSAFEAQTLSVGDVLFEEGSAPERFILLIEGEVSLCSGAEERFLLKPLAPIGELGTVTTIPRRLTAVAKTECQILSLSKSGLMAFFEQHGDVAFPFHHNLLNVVGDKVRRDEQRLDDMRSNLISTQKAMKAMRQALLDADDTPLNSQLYEQLDTLIEQNRRGHYMVEPTPAFEVFVKLDDGVRLPVAALSNEVLRVRDADSISGNENWSGVLVFPDGELPVSGAVSASVGGTVTIDLDPLIEEYETSLEDQLTRLQMLDVVV